ncbi:condensation domain-containing protein [Sphaerisporangium fuscum]|uniref:condensation domain-containing protein n=1 Tax=Sphaerisporangium fuscum TaxID=2835868 RepID=UPI001BDBD097|nr:condensation domain-containing protein [Sphaerisporangium fuscum]
MNEIVVEFHGARSGSGELTWAQREMWHLINQSRPHHHYFNFGRLFRVPKGRTVDDVASAVRQLVEIYETFRTTIRVEPDGTLGQHVAESGEYRLAKYEAGEADGELTEQVTYEYKGYSFDDDEWPLKVAVIMRDSKPSYVLFMISHLAADRLGSELACDTFARLLAGGVDGVPDGITHPLDQAAAEATPAGLRAARRAAGFWRRTLKTIPPTLFTERLEETPVSWSPAGELDSPAAALAAGSLGVELGVSSTGVVLAAVAALLGVRTGQDMIALRLFAANRTSPGLREMVGTRVQTGLFAVDLTDSSFYELIRRSWAASLLAYRYSSYPPELIREIVDEVSAERGVRFDLGCHVQDATGYKQAVLRHHSPEEVAAAAAHTHFRRSVLWDRRQLFRLDIEGTPGVSLKLRLGADPTVMTASDIETFLRGAEKLLVQAITANVALKGIPGLVGW